MFGIGMPELILIAVVALLVVGPKKLPDLAKTLGKGLNEFRKTATDVTDGLKDTIKADDIKKDVESVKNSLLYGRDEDKESSPAGSVPPSETAKNESPSAEKGPAKEG
jgi:Tat protein translocase TatB subunit